MPSVRAHSVSGAPFKGVQVIDSDPLNDDNRVVLERHGVRLVFTVTGSIGRWNVRTPHNPHVAPHIAPHARAHSGVPDI